MPYDNIKSAVAAAVASAGTITFAYPTGRDAGSYLGAFNHKLWVNDLQTLFAAPADFTVALGATAVVTYNGSTTIPAGSSVHLSLDRVGEDDGSPDDFGDVVRAAFAPIVHVALGAADTADANGICASQAITAAGTGSIDGALAASSVATFDVPRNVVAAWTTTAVMTVTGTDEYGVAIVESSASGTTMAGKKAFKTITAVDVSVDVTGATVGSGDVLGLPFFVAGAGYLVGEMEDGAAPTAGTLVAGVALEATATTGDVRGTYDPNSACDGSAVFALLIAAPDPSVMGVAQYSV